MISGNQKIYLLYDQVIVKEPREVMQQKDSKHFYEESVII